MPKYFVLANYTDNNEQDGYGAVGSALSVIGVTDDFNKIKEIAEEDLDYLANDYADSMDADDNDREEYIDDYVSDAEYRTTLSDADLELNVATLILTNEFDLGGAMERAEYYVIKVEG